MNQNKVKLYGFLSLKLENSNESEDCFVLNMFSPRTMRVIEVPVVIVGKTPFEGGWYCYVNGSIDCSPNNHNEMCVVADAIVPDKPYAITYRENGKYSFDGYMEVTFPTLDMKPPVIDVE